MAGYLYFGDALGIASMMHRDWRRADTALASIEREAKAALKMQMPGFPNRTPAQSNKARLVVFNDSVFFFSEDAAAVLHFAGVLALKLMLTPIDKGGPIAMRGSVALSSAAPTVKTASSATPCPVDATRIAADRVSAALVAEKSKVLGPRLLVEQPVLGKSVPSWPLRLTSKLMEIHTIPRAIKADTLAIVGDAASYCDLNWMVVEDDRTLRLISEAIDYMHRDTAYSSRAAAHAAAARALYKLAIARRNGLSAMLARLQRGALRAKGLASPAKRYTFADWLNSISELEALLGKSVEIPISMSELRGLPD